MRQDRDEPVRAFIARLRGQATASKFKQKYPSCETNVDYKEVTIKDMLRRGLGDSEIQMDLLEDQTWHWSRSSDS